MSGTLFNPAGCAILAAMLFGIGVFGVLARRNLVITLVSIEIMLNAASLAFVTFARQHAGSAGEEIGQPFALFIMAVAAAEAAVGLAILAAVHRSKGSVSSDKMNVMKG